MIYIAEAISSSHGEISLSTSQNVESCFGMSDCKSFNKARCPAAAIVSMSKLTTVVSSPDTGKSLSLSWRQEAQCQWIADRRDSLLVSAMVTKQLLRKQITRLCKLQERGAVENSTWHANDLTKSDLEMQVLPCVDFTSSCHCGTVKVATSNR